MLRVQLDSCSVEHGSYGGVKTVGASFRNVESLGTVIVPLDEHLLTVGNCAEEALHGDTDGLTHDVIAKVKAKMKA